MKKYLVFLLISFTTFLIPLPAIALDTSRSSIVMDLDSGRILYQNNAKEKRLIASTTKILTAIVTLENAKLNKTVEIGEEVLKMYGTNIYIEVGEKIKVKDLLYGLLLRSGNDASVALANVVCKNEEEFIKLMNKKAQEIGMKDSSFANPHGLDEDTKNYSTAYDMALLSRYAYQNEKYREIVSTKKYITKTENKTYLWYNRNKLLNNYEYCTGGKNGYTPSAGKTLVTTATKNNLNLTIVTLNDPNIYDTHEDLYEEIFAKYQNYTIIDKNNFKIDKSFYDGNPYIKQSFVYPLSEDEIDQIKTEVHIKNTSVSNNKKIGNITIKLNNTKIGSIDIYNKATKKEDKSIFRKLRNLFL